MSWKLDLQSHRPRNLAKVAWNCLPVCLSVHCLWNFCSRKLLLSSAKFPVCEWCDRATVRVSFTRSELVVPVVTYFQFQLQVYFHRNICCCCWAEFLFRLSFVNLCRFIRSKWSNTRSYSRWARRKGVKYKSGVRAYYIHTYIHHHQYFDAVGWVFWPVKLSPG